MSGAVWGSLVDAARVLCPPLEIVREEPARLHLVLRDPTDGHELWLGYRSARGLFYRTYFLVARAELQGTGPPEAVELVLRRRGLVWRRPRPSEARRWRDAVAGPEIRAALKGIRAERMTLGWRPEARVWSLRLETLSGGVTTTFFPPLDTPNPMLPPEAQALLALLETLKAALLTAPATAP